MNIYRIIAVVKVIYEREVEAGIFSNIFLTAEWCLIYTRGCSVECWIHKLHPDEITPEILELVISY